MACQLLAVVEVGGALLQHREVGLGAQLRLLIRVRVLGLGLGLAFG